MLLTGFPPPWRASVRLLLGLLAGVATTASPRAADGFLGAEALLRAVAEESAKPTTPTTTTNAHAKFRTELEAFRKSSGQTPAPEAARRWLEFVDRAAKPPYEADMLVPPSDPGPNPVTYDDIFAALPPPGAWSELAKAVEARPAADAAGKLRELGLRFLATTLTGNEAGRREVIAAVMAFGETADRSQLQQLRPAFQLLNHAVVEASEEPDLIVRLLEQQLDQDSEYGARSVRLPHLLSRVGPEKTEALLRRALLRTGKVSIELDAVTPTAALARKLALEMIDQLPAAPWNLVDSIESVDLYEALARKFDGQPAAPKPADAELLPGIPTLAGWNVDRAKTAADAYYLLGLIAKGRTLDAVKAAEKRGKASDLWISEALKSMIQAGYALAVDDFFHGLLTKDPSLKYWDTYVEVAAVTGRTERMVSLARAVAARTDVTRETHAAIRQVLHEALLAADEIEEGAAELRRILASDDARLVASRGQYGVQLARVGSLMNRPEWTEEGLKAARAWLAKPPSDNTLGYGALGVVPGLATLLVELGRGAEAEAALKDALVITVRNSAGQPQFDYRSDSPSQRLLAQLAAVYHRTGRFTEITNLFNLAPYWQAGDLTELLQSDPGSSSVFDFSGHLPASKLPLAFLAGHALSKTGRAAEARPIARALLRQFPGSDRAYELLLDVEPPADALARFDEQFALDRFEERPLIWKAHLLRRQNRLPEAEAAVRQAIAIDPSDGEQGPGDRLRAYAELAEIRAARGDAKEAESLRQAVTAIRLSEKADRFFAAGLLRRATRLYEESLTHFSDAYCIHSRLAIQLARLGQFAAAEKHFEKAYELMPDSFGRVESHCFGCERAFEGKPAQTMAEKILGQIAVRRPDKPQVHYLLGYLRREQGRHAAALTNFQTAVRLDPDYLNAWAKIQETARHVRIAPKDRDAVVQNLLRLDPGQSHVQVQFRLATDLPALWRTLESNTRPQPPRETELLPLAAARKLHAEAEKSAPRSAGLRYRDRLGMSMTGLSPTTQPAQALAETPFVQVAISMLGGNPGGSGYMLE